MNFLDIVVGFVNFGGMLNIFGVIFVFFENVFFVILIYGVFIVGVFSFLDVIFGLMLLGGFSLIEIVKDILEDVLIEYEVKDMEDIFNNFISFWNNEFYEFIL